MRQGPARPKRRSSQGQHTKADLCGPLIHTCAIRLLEDKRLLCRRVSADSESEARRRMRPSTMTSLGDGASGFRKGGVRSQRSLSQQQASQGGVMCSLVRHLSGRPAEAAQTRGPVARAPGFLFPTHHPPSRPGGQVASSPGAGVALQLARSAGLAFGLG